LVGGDGGDPREEPGLPAFRGCCDPDRIEGWLRGRRSASQQSHQWAA